MGIAATSDLSLAAALARATEALRAAGIDGPAREARLLLAHAQGRPSGLPALDAPVPPAFWAALERRRAREPMALVLGEQGFWTLRLEVSGDTLVPRADSETLVEAALAEFPDRDGVRRVLDLGTGTGALLLAALAEFPSAWGVGVDIWPAACALAQRNAGRHAMAGRAGFLAGDWAASLSGRFDLVVANPPYIATDDLPDLMPEVGRHEPARALDGGADGLAAYRAIIPDLGHLLAADGVAILELGQGQERAVAQLARASGLGVAAIRADLSGIGRAIVLRPPDSPEQRSKKSVGRNPSGD